MRVSFIAQGLTVEGNSVGKTVLESFSDTVFTKFSCLVAFVSSPAIQGIANIIEESKSHITDFNVVVGIDQDATSKEALELLLGLGINSKVYYTATPIIFHPKIYVFDSDSKCRIIIGSSNLTKAGLFQNVEASLMLDFDKPDSEGEEILNQIKTYFDTLFADSGTNIKPLSSTLIDELFQSGIVPDRADNEERRKEHEITTRQAQNAEVVGRVRTLFPTVPIQRLPEGFGRTTRVRRVPTTARTTSTTTRGALLWEKVLTPSDILQAKAGTNPTGSLRLSQARRRDIDQTTYFRQDIFGSFRWVSVRARNPTEATTVLFNVKILGVDKGNVSLEIRHKPSLEAGQGNFTTSISWGTLSNDIRAQNLTGRTLHLYAPQQGTNEPFFIEID